MLLAGAVVAVVADGVEVVGAGAFAVFGAVRRKLGIVVPVPSTLANKLSPLRVAYVAVMLRLEDIVTPQVTLLFPPVHCGDANHPVKRRSGFETHVPDVTLTLDVDVG